MIRFRSLLPLAAFILLACGAGSPAVSANSTPIPESAPRASSDPTPFPVVHPSDSAAGSTPSTLCHIRGALPDARCTPGATNPVVTQATIAATICVTGWTATIRPPSTYTDALKRSQIAEYGYADTALADYEEDHLIPLELGGDPRNPLNLWPQPNTVPGSHEKDRLENLLKVAVCNGSLTLVAAQSAIAGDWQAAYRRYVEAAAAATPMPIAPTAAPAPPPPPAGDPMAALRAQGVSAICNDGTYSFSHTRSGTCSHHGGVAQWTGLI